MANEKRDFVDDLGEKLRRFLEDIDRLINPEKQPKRAPVPVPVRPNADPRDPRQYPPRG